MVVSSYTEDEFGVVQKDIPGIIFALLAVLTEIDRHSRVSGKGERVQQSVFYSLKREIRASVESEIRENQMFIIFFLWEDFGEEKKTVWKNRGENRSLQHKSDRLRIAKKCFLLASALRLY